MTLAPHRIGIDVSKAWLDVYDAATERFLRVPNHRQAVDAFVATLPAGALVVFEATAPYDLELRRAVSGRCRARRVNPSRARDFARAAGFLAKTDAVDARMLTKLPDALDIPDEPPLDDAREALAALNRRRDQLVEMRAIERGRLVDEPDAELRESLQNHIDWLDAAIPLLDAKIAAAIKTPALAPTVALLGTVNGVGPVTIAILLALLPELGARTAKEIAALAGLAPLNRDSGAMRGKRSIAGGRRRVRQALYMAALNTIRCIPRFKAFYDAVKQRSGHAKVAIIAVARKLLVTLNSMIKAGEPFKA